MRLVYDALGEMAAQALAEVEWLDEKKLAIFYYPSRRRAYRRWQELQRMQDVVGEIGMEKLKKAGPAD